MQADAWTPDNWIAIAGIAATLIGVWLGSRLTQTATQQERLRQDVDLALVKVDMALDATRIDDLSSELMLDQTTGLNHSRIRLESLKRGEPILFAREALAIVRIRHPSTRVRELAQALDIELAQVNSYTLAWYDLFMSEHRTTDDRARDRLNRAMNDASNAHERAQVHWRDMQEQTRKGSRRPVFRR